ncbi:hypothetical protein [Micromonospora sp. NPDC049799]|uniref:hypothetical protein n=1 Tax=Micromonospora sp. NPDC049799 TaxID=3154741 RepID=UPI0033CBFC68
MKLTPEEQWALNAPWTELIARGEVEVEYEPRPVVTVFPVRLGPADGMWVAKEADRRGVTPSMLIEDLVSQARRAADSCSADENAGDGPGLQD